MKRLAIINRKCFNRKSKQKRSDLLEYLCQKLNANIKFSEYPGHIYQILNNCDQYNMIIAAGGDGTIHEVINSMDIKNQSLMIIPIGMGNTLAKDLGINAEKMRPPDAERSISIDLIKCTFTTNEKKTMKYSFSTTGFGFSSNACFLANRKLKLLGSLGYKVAGMIKLVSKKELTAHVSIDDSPSEKKLLNYIFINNTKHVAHFEYFPDAKLDDGFFDGIITYKHTLRMLLFLLGVKLKNAFLIPFKYIKMKKISFVLAKPEILMLDGEIYPDITQVEYAIQEKSLHLILNNVCIKNCENL